MHRRSASAVAVLLWILLSHRLGLSGLEYGLHSTLVLGAACYYALRFTTQVPPIRDQVALGCLLACVFLSRLDAGLLVVTVVWVASRRRDPGRPDARGLVALAAPTVAAGLCYAGTNWWIFGAPTPVSAAVKRSWSQLALEQDPVYQQAGWLAAKVVHWWWPLAEGWDPSRIALVAGTWIIGGVWVARRRLRLAHLETLTPLILYSNLSFGLYALAYHGISSRTIWYYTVPPMLASVLFAVGFERVGEWALTLTRRGAPRAVRAGAWVASLTVLGCVVAIPLQTVRGIQSLRPAVTGSIGPALAAMQALPADAILASWNSGTLTYRSERTVVNLDGLVNSWNYHLETRRDLCRYWRGTGVTHLVDFFDFTMDPPMAPILASYRSLYDYRPCVERLRLVWANEQLPASERIAIFALDDLPR